VASPGHVKLGGAFSQLMEVATFGGQRFDTAIPGQPNQAVLPPAPAEPSSAPATASPTQSAAQPSASAPIAARTDPPPPSNSDAKKIAALSNAGAEKKSLANPSPGPTSSSAPKTGTSTSVAPAATTTPAPTRLNAMNTLYKQVDWQQFDADASATRADPSALGRLPAARRQNLESGREALEAYAANKDRINEQFTAIKSGLDRQKELREARVATIDQAALEGKYAVATSTGANATQQIAPAFTVESDLKDAYTESRSDDSKTYKKMHDVVNRFSESYTEKDTSVSSRFEFADTFKTPPDVAAAALPTSIVDARNVPSGLPKFVEDSLPHTPAGGDLRKGYQAIQGHNWNAALTWFRTAQNLEPSDAGIARLVGLAEYMNERRNGALPASNPSSSPTVSGRDGPVVSRPPVTAADRVQLDKLLDKMEDDLTHRAIESIPSQNTPNADGGTMLERMNADPKFTAARDRIIADEDRAEIQVRHQAVQTFRSFLDSQGSDWVERLRDDKAFIARVDRRRDEIWQAMDRDEIGARAAGLGEMRDLVNQWEKTQPAAP
jgi:hypothetical protein